MRIDRRMERRRCRRRGSARHTRECHRHRSSGTSVEPELILTVPVQVSFVVPCYNYGRFLTDCLSSIFRQEGDYSFEIVAVDDASTDDTLHVLEAFADPRLKVVRHESNQGHVKTITRGLREASGQFIARIDPD